jgi:hypothetical protein
MKIMKNFMQKDLSKAPNIVNRAILSAFQIVEKMLHLVWHVAGNPVVIPSEREGSRFVATLEMTR